MKQLNKKGAIGIIMILALFVLTYSLVQASVVPFWDKEVEAEHIDLAYGDMMSLRSNIEAVVESGSTKSSVVRIGVPYPNRILFFNPAPGAAGSITVENIAITGRYNASGASTHPINYNSSRMIYTLNGMIHSPKLVYEHGIIIWDWGDGRIVTLNCQPLINEDTSNIHIPVVEATPGITSGLATKTFDISPYMNTSNRTGVESFTITLDTDYPLLWSNLLEDYIKTGLVSVSNTAKKIYISSSAFPYISLPDQPSQAAVSAGVISFNHELPPGAVVSILPISAQEIKVVENNATSTPKLTLTPKLDDLEYLVISGGGGSVGSSSNGGGGGGGSGGGISSSIVDEPPTVSTENATNVSVTTATLNMCFDFNDYETIKLQFRYKAEGAGTWTETDLITQNGSGAHTFAEPIANLSPNTTYYFMAIVLYDSTELKSNELNFSTFRTPIAPTIVTENATTVTTVTATLNMAYEFNDYSPVNVKFQYKAEGASAWNETGWVTQNGSNTYSELITGLSSNATYYFTAMLLYDGTVIEGVENSFRTLEPPTVTTEKATNISSLSAILNMAFDFNDYSRVNVQFRYKAENASVWNETGWVVQNGSGAHTFAEPITNLSATTTYHFSAMLLYDDKELNGTEVMFTTSREPLPPTVWTGNVTNVSDTSKTLNKGFQFSALTIYDPLAKSEKTTCVSAANVTLDMGFDFHDYSSVMVQFRYKAEDASAWNETGWVAQNGSGIQTYTKQISNLSSNTTYYYMAMLLYDGIEVNGSVQSFTTCRDPIPPTVATENATNVSVATATLNMAYVFNDYSPVNVQFRYKAEGVSVWNETGWVTRNGSHTYSEPITNLSSNTTYYYTAMLLYDGTVIEGVDKSFRTLEPPTVMTENATNISDLAATLNMSFYVNDYKTVQVQFRYKAEGASAWNTTDWVTRNASSAHWYEEQIANLSANTTYYFMAMLFYDSTELNGTELSFRTSRKPIPPTVWTGNATNNPPTSATRNMVFSLSAKNNYYSLATAEKETCIPAANVTLDMGFDFHDYSSVMVQFRYKAEGATEWTDSGWVEQNGSSKQTYAKQIANLSANTTYYFMAMLLYDDMVINGSVHTFTTCRELITPTVWTRNATNVSVAAATLNMAYNFYDYSPVQVQFRYKAEGASAWAETGWIAKNGSGVHTYAEQIANLSYITIYYFKAQLLYDGMEIEGVEKSFITLEPPTVHTKTATNITDAIATLNMAFDFNDYDSVQVKYRYKAKEATEWNDTGWVAQNGSGYHWYSEPIAGLSSSRVYQFKAQLRYDDRVIEGLTRSFITMEKPTVSSRTAIVHKLPRGWAVTLRMDYDFKDYDQGYLRFAYKKVGDAEWDNTDWICASHSGTYDEVIMGLEEHATYYFKAQLKYGDENNIGGDTLSFNTLGPR